MGFCYFKELEFYEFLLLKGPGLIACSEAIIFVSTLSVQIVFGRLKVHFFFKFSKIKTEKERKMGYSYEAPLNTCTNIHVHELYLFLKENFVSIWCCAKLDIYIWLMINDLHLNY